MISSTHPKVKAGALYASMEASKILGVHKNSLLNFAKANVLHAQAGMITGRNLFEGREQTRFWYS